LLSQDFRLDKFYPQTKIPYQTFYLLHLIRISDFDRSKNTLRQKLGLQLNLGIFRRVLLFFSLRLKLLNFLNQHSDHPYSNHLHKNILPHNQQLFLLINLDYLLLPQIRELPILAFFFPKFWRKLQDLQELYQHFADKYNYYLTQHQSHYDLAVQDFF